MGGATTVDCAFSGDAIPELVAATRIDGEATAQPVTERTEMATRDKRPGSESSPGRNLLPEEADDVAGAITPPRDAQADGGQVPEPGLNLEIETLDAAAGGATAPTIKIKINANLDDAD